MTSKIGNNGFTLIEIMVTVAILALGTVVIEEGMLRSARVLGRYANGLAVEREAGEILWNAQEALLYSADAGSAPAQGSFEGSNRPIDWTIDHHGVPGTKDLYAISLNMAWNEGNRPVTVNRTVYAAK